MNKILLLAVCFLSLSVRSQKIEIPGPVGSGQFGIYTNVLPNGNYVVIDYDYDDGAIIDAGAVYLYNGSSHSLISTLKGSNNNDQVGRGGIRILADGNYVVSSWAWDSNRGAATFCNATTGFNGIVSGANSLVGQMPGDRLASGILLLTNGHYVVTTGQFSSGTVNAATWCNKNGSTTGVISTANSLYNNAGYLYVLALPNGNYVVISPEWNNFSTGGGGAGAAVLCNGNTGYSGTITTANSIHGTKTGDHFPWTYAVLSNGNYVLSSYTWDNGTVEDVGAVTWCSGTSATIGNVSPSNSLIGANAYDRISENFLYLLSNGNYVVASSSVNIGGVKKGAVTWCNGTGVTTGTVNAANSLTGTQVDDMGQVRVTPLTNGHYVVESPYWANGAVAYAGAVTWCNGTTTTSAVVSTANSMTGTTEFEFLGGFNGAIPLPNGNYILRTTNWDNGTETDAGAITLCNGTTGTVGTISTSNSITGTSANDKVGGNGYYTILTNGNCVIGSPNWKNGMNANAGAATLIDANIALTGNISTGNSLCGSSAGDQVGVCLPLPNGNFVAVSPYWNNGAIIQAGAATLCTTITSGTVSASNSIVGTQSNDHVGGNVLSFPDGSFALLSADWKNGALNFAGAVTWHNGSVQTNGVVNTCNSVTGSVARTFGNYFNTTYNTIYQYLLVANYNENKVVVFKPSTTPLSTVNGEKTISIIGPESIPVIDESGCGLLLSIKKNGAVPVSGSVQSKVWIESSVPSYYGQPYVARHFEVTPASNTATATGRITLYFTQQEFTDFNNHANSILNLPANPTDATGKSNLRIGKYSGVSNDGSGLPASYTETKSVIDPDDNDIVWNATLSRWEVAFNVTGFSGFIVQTYEFVLPLDFLSFSAQKCNNSNVCLNWKTANEQNVSHFEVERSSDGVNYSVIGTVAAGGNNYNYEDRQPIWSSKNLYYRIKQVDIDNRSKRSTVAWLKGDNTGVQLYPTLVENSFAIQNNTAKTMWLQLTDGSGKMVLQQRLAAGTNVVSADRLAKGVYFYAVKNTEGETATGRIVKQ